MEESAADPDAPSVFALSVFFSSGGGRTMRQGRSSEAVPSAPPTPMPVPNVQLMKGSETPLAAVAALS